jgi:COP9 signalosome complex subunit 4
MSAAKTILALPTVEARKQAITQMLAAADDGIAELIAALAEESTIVATAKPLLAHTVEYAAGDDCSGDYAIAITTAVLQHHTKRIASFGDEVVRAREVLADVYEGNEAMQQAYGVLVAMPVDAGLRSADDAYKASLYVRIANIAVSLENESNADQYINKAWPLMKAVTNPELRLQFESCFALVSDSKRKFLDAAQRFYNLSLQLDAAERMLALRKSIVCVVLADAGPRRARLLATLYKDERAAALGDLHGILTKLYHARVLRPRDIAVLQPDLKPHYKALMADGRTVFDNAITQHNLLCAAQLYYNIRFSELGALLGVAPDVAERIAARMIVEDRLKASIDQVAQLVTFLSDPSAPVLQWDQQIAAVCHSVSAAADDVAVRHPQLARALVDA